MFNLTDELFFESKVSPGIEQDCGPHFGGDNQALMIYLDPKFIKNSCSKINPDQYDIGTDSKGRNNLTKQVQDDFTVTEMEVWEEICNKDALT